MTDDDLDLEAVPESYDHAVRLLAAWHASIDPAMRVYKLPDDQPDESRREVRLIEVSDEFPEGGAMWTNADGVREQVIPIFRLGPLPDYPYRTGVAQVTAGEWDQLRDGTLRLTQPWDLSGAEKVRGDD